jgi:hypothetical protein
MTAAVLIVAACGGSDGGSDCPAYANIVGGTFARTGAMTTWTMELEELPATLPFDQTDVPANVLEYAWTIELDPDSDGDRDLELSVKHFRMSNATEMEKPILDGTQQDLWTIMGPAGSLSGDITATIAGNVITFIVEDSEDPMLPMVTQTSQGTWSTFTKFGAALGDQCEDTFRP